MLPALRDRATAQFKAALTDLGHDRIEAAHDSLIAADPRAIKPQADKALLLQQLGAFDDAEKIFRKLLRKHPHEGELYRIFIASLNVGKGEPLYGAMKKALAHPQQSDAGRMHLQFALAKAAEDLGQRDKVFAHLTKANALQAKAFPMNWPAREAEEAAIVATQDDLPPMRDGGGAVRPVFIIGMPRSGTTLVEHILSRHSAVAAGGELGHVMRHFARVFGQGPFRAVDGPGLAAFGDGYLGLARLSVGGAGPVITDKSMQSQLVLGALHRALPEARFLHVTRDPRDIALSIYRNFFAGGTHRYANDLADIARAVRAFDTHMARWQARFPGLIQQVSYEALVQEPEPQIRALVAAAGLDWEEACLDPTAGAARVKTLSLAQVRQPIHTGRKAAWERYAPEMKPFLDAWGEMP